MIRLDREEQLAVLTVDNPPLNLLDDATEAALHTAIDDLASEPPRGVLIRAEGKVWTGGVDVKLFAALGEPANAEKWFSRCIATVQKLEDLPCPVVFAAHGLCLTWGFELALACDVVLAAESARFGLVEARVGLTPSWGGPQRLTQRVGPARAKHLVMLGKLYDAQTLSDWGVVTEVYADGDFAERSRELAMALATGPTRAHATTKRLIAIEQAGGHRAADVATPEISGALFGTQDLQGALRSFLEDGPETAIFEGR